jgi:hypothetical protein
MMPCETFRLHDGPNTWWPAVAVVLGTTVLAGCGRSTGATVSGRVTIDGQPAPPGIRIDFQPEVAGGSSSTGYTDADGRYVMPGESVVRLSIPQDFTGGGAPQIPDKLRGVRLPESVGRETTLRKTVKPGHNEIDIAVETQPTR